MCVSPATTKYLDEKAFAVDITLESFVIFQDLSDEIRKSDFIS